MSELFMSASKILRDNLVTELQTEVNFLRNYIVKKQDETGDKLYGRKVKITEHNADMTTQIIYDGDAIFLGIHKTHGYGKVLRINDGNKGKLCLIRLENIEFVDAPSIFN